VVAPAIDRQKVRLLLRDWTGRRRRLAIGLTTVALGLFGAALGVSLPARVADTGTERTLAASGAAVGANGHASVLSAKSVARKQMPNPVRISIPSIGVNARVIALGLNRDRTIEVPKNFSDTGWFQPGPEPGEQGAAVIVGHVASRSGPAVFYRLRELRRGQVITIHLQGGSTVRYVADSMIRVPKSRFPTSRVYAQTKQPTLRLITCAGTLNPSTGHHPDNYIVFASLVR
jgi:LPXTG-site transpeptidase (sortase) family protein